MAVVGRCGTEALEKGPSRPVRGKIAGPAGGVLARQFAKAGQICRKTLEFRINGGIGTVGGDDIAVPAAVEKLAVPGKLIGRGVGRCQHFHIELLEQGAGPEAVPSEAVVDMVVVAVGGVGRQDAIDSEEMFE